MAPSDSGWHGLSSFDEICRRLAVPPHFCVGTVLRYRPRDSYPKNREVVSVFCEERNNAQKLQVPGDRQLQEAPWHVLHVRSNFEKRVAQHLAARFVEHYLPLYREHVKWTDRSVVTERPLFSGYVFARFKPDTRITVISVPGVVRSLGDEEGKLVSCTELDKIREGLASGLLIRPHANVSAGARVRIRAGLFEGMEGIVTEFRAQCKVILSLAAVQQSFSLETDLGEIEVLKKPPVRHDPSIADAYRGWRIQSAHR